MKRTDQDLEETGDMISIIPCDDQQHLNPCKFCQNWHGKKNYLTMEDSDKVIPVKDKKPRGKVEIDIQKCKGCELCTVACKKQSLSLSDTINIKGYHYIIANNEACNACMDCALVCPDAVITVYKIHRDKKRVDVTPSDIKEQLKAMVYPEKINGV